MKKYTAPEVQLFSDTDVITTSTDVTTGGVKIPWEVSDGSRYQLLSFTKMDLDTTGDYEI